MLLVSNIDHTQKMTDMIQLAHPNPNHKSMDKKKLIKSKNERSKTIPKVSKKFSNNMDVSSDNKPRRKKSKSLNSTILFDMFPERPKDNNKLKRKRGMFFLC